MASLTDYRDNRITALCEISTDLVLDPNIIKQGVRATEVLVKELGSVEMLVILVSSSNPGYAEQDLPSGIRVALGTARHNVKILQLLYPPTPKSGT